MMQIMEDAEGLYLVLKGGNEYRPGPIWGYSLVYDMSDGGLRAGDTPQVESEFGCRGDGSPFVKITLGNSQVVHWAKTSMHEAQNFNGEYGQSPQQAPSHRTMV